MSCETLSRISTFQIDGAELELEALPAPFVRAFAVVGACEEEAEEMGLLKFSSERNEATCASRREEVAGMMAAALRALRWDFGAGFCVRRWRGRVFV